MEEEATFLKSRSLPNRQALGTRGHPRSLIRQPRLRSRNNLTGYVALNTCLPERHP